MPANSVKRLGAIALLMSSISSMALAQTTETTLDPIIVKGATGATSPAEYVLDLAPGAAGPAADGADLLRQVPGIDTGRMSGHGLEIVIRGQQQNQLNVIDAGSFTLGGCPNRMDPPASTAFLNLADRVIVQRGYQSVTNGAGGTGGTVILERDAPKFSPDKRWNAEALLGGVSNSNTLEGGVKAAFDLGNGFYVSGFAHRKTADDYEDGNGDTVLSSYNQKSYGLTFGLERDGLSVALDRERDVTEDVLYSGANMDSPLSETDIWRLRVKKDVSFGPLQRIEASAYLSEVDHVMDNYSLRPVGMMASVVPSESDTYGGKIEGQLDFGTTTAKVGVDMQSNNRMATVYQGSAAMVAQVDALTPGLARAYMWPDVTIAQYGLYGETETALSERLSLKLGARYDHVISSADAAASAPAGSPTTANDLYTTYYGTTFDDDRTEDNFSGLARFEYALSDQSKAFFGLSHSVRTADTTERAIARTTWVGNPDLDPEQHNQIDIGFETIRDSWHFNATAYTDRVSDYILRDAFTFAGVTTYRNIGARLSGVEIAGGWQRGGFDLSGDATWTHGQNLDDNQPLAQIPALAGKIVATYGQNDWSAGARINWAMKQTRIDASRDAGETPGYTTLDLFGTYDVRDGVVLMAGMNNVLDKTYANHLSRSNVVEPTMTQVNEPGRNVYLTLQATF